MTVRRRTIVEWIVVVLAACIAVSLVLPEVQSKPRPRHAPAVPANAAP